MDCRYNDLNAYLKKIFGCRVQKISIDAGLTCPNRDGSISNKGCIYCNERGSGTGRHKQGWTISRQVEEGIKALSKRYKAKKFIAYFQSFTNTYGHVERLKPLYEEALSFKDVVGLSVGTRPDCIDEEKLNLLQAYADDYMVWIEYGLQSANDKTLALINRGHDVDCFKNAVKMSRGKGIKICAHVILGLPGESKEDMMNTAKTLAGLNIEGVKIHLMYVVKNTELERLYSLGQYFCLDLKQYVELVCDFLELLPGETVIQRLTGDPHPDELIAPKWSLNKTQTISLIRRALGDRDTRQGKRFKIQDSRFKI